MHPWQNCLFPKAIFNVTCLINISIFLFIAIKHQIKTAFMVSECCSPYAITICIFIIFQTVCLVIFNDIWYIWNDIPMLQIPGAQNWDGRCKMYRCCCHIISITNPYYLRIRIIQINDRIMNNIFHFYLMPFNNILLFSSWHQFILSPQQRMT